MGSLLKNLVGKDVEDFPDKHGSELQASLMDSEGKPANGIKVLGVKVKSSKGREGVDVMERLTPREGAGQSPVREGLGDPLSSPEKHQAESSLIQFKRKYMLISVSGLVGSSVSSSYFY